MVLLNAAKSARNAAKLVSRGNCGGTAKKSGLAPTIGTFMPSNPNLNRANNTLYGKPCVVFRTNTSQSALRAIRR